MHSFKTSGRQLAQCKCRWCGVYGNRGECIPDEVKSAIAAFAREHGRMWRSELRKLWESGKDEGALRVARNVIGPGKIHNITDFILKRIAAVAA